MPADDTKIVRVRANVSGERLIGYVPLPPGEFSRFSDVLNGAEPHIFGSRPGGATGTWQGAVGEGVERQGGSNIVYRPSGPRPV